MRSQFAFGGHMPNRTAIFIDGAYLEHVLREEFGIPTIDFHAFSQYMAQDSDILRSYYYHCPPYQDNPPTEEQSQRYSNRRRFFTALERLPRYTVRLGRVEFRGNRSDGSPIFQQKRVDILLGMDIALLSAKGQIQQAILVAGDSDFIPAIEVAKNEGVLVTLYHGASPHSDLWRQADERFRIDQDMIDKTKRGN